MTTNITFNTKVFEKRKAMLDPTFGADNSDEVLLSDNLSLITDK